ncbi:homeobox protein onecut [Eurosta solidaginis]|uniref:homeobox protein onecut n=1 Tax=Eurosta solidaginis TaxID=178769 RepID=UPI00353074D1
MRMEPAAKVVDHQSLSSQLVESNELVRRVSSNGTSIENSSNNTTFVIRNRTLSYSPVSSLCAHDVVDDMNVVEQTLVTASDDNVSEDETASPFVVVRTIIDGLSHSPVHSTFQKTIHFTARDLHGEHFQIAQEHHQRQPQHLPLLEPRQILQFKNAYQHLEQLDYQGLENRLHGCSPIDFVGTAVKLNELSTCSSPKSNVANVIASKAIHKEFIIDKPERQLQNIRYKAIRDNCNIYDDDYREKKISLDITHVEDNVKVNVGDNISSEVVLSQHFHEHKNQQEFEPGNISSLVQHSHTIRLHGQQLLLHDQQIINSAMYEKNHKSHGTYNSASTEHNETLSVIIQQQKGDSRDSGLQIASPVLGRVSVGVLSNQLIQPAPCNPLSSPSEEISPPEFNPTSSYATLTPLQPLPPISTMSHKFAYGGHINGSGVNISGSGCTNSPSNSSSESVEAFGAMPNQNSLGALSLSSLGVVQSPYSTYNKLSSMGISMSPPHNYTTSPSHSMNGMVIACELRTALTSPCVALSPQSAYSYSTELHSPTQSHRIMRRNMAMAVDGDCNSNLSHDTTSIETCQVGLHKKVVSISPPRAGGNEAVLADNIIMTEFKSAHNTHKHEILVTSTSISATSTCGQSPRIQLHHGPILSSQSASKKSVPFTLSGSYKIDNQPAATLAPINSETTTLSIASLQSNDLINISPPAIVWPRASSPHPEEENTSTNLSAQKPRTYMHMQVSPLSQQPSQQYKQTGKSINTDTSDSYFNLNKNNNPSLSNAPAEKGMLPTNKNKCIAELQDHQSVQAEPQNELYQTKIRYENNKSPCNSSSASAAPHSCIASTGSANLIGNISNLRGAEVGCIIGDNKSSPSNTIDVVEINTKDLAQRISAELKRYSIPQAIFAQRVLCRSQGTLSDLLRNPKPWSKLKSGRETFRRMYKWLQEPEFQRMSALRIAAAQIPQRITNNNTITRTIAASNRMVNSDSSNITLLSNSNSGELFIFI